MYIASGCSNRGDDIDLSSLKESDEVLRYQIEYNLARIEELEKQLAELSSLSEDMQVQLSELDTINNLDENEPLNYDELGNILFYISKLKDKDFVRPYGHEEEPYTWYISAEELGLIGKPAIPYLIKNLETKDMYEKAVTLYALLLASQDEEIFDLTNGEYIKVNLFFDDDVVIKNEEIALTWWEKYEYLFE